MTYFSVPMPVIRWFVRRNPWLIHGPVSRPINLGIVRFTMRMDLTADNRAALLAEAAQRKERENAN